MRTARQTHRITSRPSFGGLALGGLFVGLLTVVNVLFWWPLVVTAWRYWVG